MVNLLALVGPTASGKSRMAVEVALELWSAYGVRTEILSCDAMAVYRGLDIVAAKPSPDDRAAVPHHLLDLVDTDVTFTAVAYRQAAREAIAAVSERGSVPLVVGGSGLYFRAAVDELEFAPSDPQTRRALEQEETDELWGRLLAADPQAAGWLDRRNRRRVIRAVEILELTGRPPSAFRGSWRREGPYELTVVGLTWAREQLAGRAERRFRQMLDSGMVEEVRRAAAYGLSGSAAQAVGVKELMEYTSGRLSLEDAAQLYVRNVKRLIRRQLSWFRADPRVTWLDVSDLGWERAGRMISEIFAQALEPV